MSDMVNGPLAGVRVVELAGIGPGPFAAMLLADLGADVVRVDRVGPPAAEYTPNPVLERSRRSIAVDLKHPRGAEVVLRLAAGADVLLESMRPGVAERLGVGPQQCLAVRPQLVYGRMTGFGQSGPLAAVAGHDINYLAHTGALGAIGRAGQDPVPPLNLVGDLGGGALFLALGVVSALRHSALTGRGQVVDAAVVDGTGALMALVHGLAAMGRWQDARGVNLLDTGCPYYDVYRCADGRHVAVGTIERRFFLALLTALGLDDRPDLVAAHGDREHWPALRAALGQTFAGAPREEWVRRLAGLDVCVSPVLDLAEATGDEHARARGAYLPVPGHPGAHQPAPAPRFDLTPAGIPRRAPMPGEHTRLLLAEAGYRPDEIAVLVEAGAVSSGPPGPPT